MGPLAWMAPLLVEECQGFPTWIKQMLTRATEACLDKPNARKAYSLVLKLVLLRPRVRACDLKPLRVRSGRGFKG